MSKTIKKYNQALVYCQQDSKDLAVIQLKKVLSLNPRFILLNFKLCRKLVTAPVKSLISAFSRPSLKYILDTNMIFLYKYTSLETLKRLFEQYPEYRCQMYDSVSEAFRELLHSRRQNERVYIAGSSPARVSRKTRIPSSL